ncbi:hypothetical protein [Microbaculum marinum]|uniref:DUF1828 domain-containing protein n=1 Tax=Microbaculum marinum TaxID=1764581 RepID=A0AAW9RQS7_9HYPH
MSCEDVQAAFGPGHQCVETGDGARVTTHCLYPSFDPVDVFVVRNGNGFRVHDGGGAERSAWAHGRDEKMIRRMLNRHAARHHIKVVNDVLVADAPSIDWLRAAILAVANASANAATAVVERVVAAAEHDLSDRVFRVLSRAFMPATIGRASIFIGMSGKQHEFDFVVRPSKDKTLLIDTVAPHHVSIASKYVAFADTRFEDGSGIDRFAVYDRPLESSDVSLLQQVADLVPYTSLEAGLKRALI